MSCNIPPIEEKTGCNNYSFPRYAYSFCFESKSVFRNGDYFGEILEHNPEKKYIKLKCVSKNRYMHGQEIELIYS